MPRGLIFLAAAWLVGSWIAAMGTTTPVHATSPSYEPGVRLMLQIVVLGLGIGWPLLRLSQPTKPAPIRQVLLDLLVLLTLLQVVIWLPRLLTTWLVIRTAAVDALLAGWTVLIGVVVAAGVRTNNPTARTLVMLVCVLLSLLGPVLAWFGLHITLDQPKLALLGPFMSVRELTEAGSIAPRPDQWKHIIIIWAIAIGAWITLLIRESFSTPSESDGPGHSLAERDGS